ncbi:hypothetical protein H312_02243 [Anncaliia algerae PRA339]|uniref:Uncharacterized protein n=1 Tax=Anncaliia algerae PRA339 TaxID=1288291 RepID=A0A059F021_9MICR|nr:hypothetical protein H312_02243 [Anncaliia algerae PRA339]
MLIVCGDNLTKILFLSFLNIFKCLNLTNTKVVPVVFSSGRESPSAYITFEKFNDNTPIFIYRTRTPTVPTSFKYYTKIRGKVYHKQDYVIFKLPKLPLNMIYTIVFIQNGIKYSTKPFVYSTENENYVFWTPNPIRPSFSWVLFGISMGVILLFIIGLIYLVVVDDLRFC